MAVLITGGTGYIGSHTVVELVGAGKEAVILDNFYNSKPEIIGVLKEITGSEIKFCDVDIRDEAALEKVFGENAVDEVIHFAGYKAVAESVAKPLDYYGNNVCGAVALLGVMKKFGCKRFVFSSSATVYGMPEKVPVTETSALSAINPYGRTKLIIEDICRDIYNSDNEWSFSLLRYFNPVGAHESGKLREDPNGLPNNLMPIILRAATGEIPALDVYGNDYPTPDGTCVRDYIHVVDLAKGHVAALNGMKKGVEAYNLGTGKGYSVLEMIETFKRVTGAPLPYRFVPRRAGDAAQCWSDPSKAKRELNWEAKFDIEKMCADAWRAARNKDYTK
ncbi:MAG: UDP-glucose 4-epimerase GalE [Oscillospiraceae bacterium]|jgi:UDP-glucose 4-epimerase|nr:UDP-glucose 4-epimerase GalE [Oscillospiraceae bacterium]